MSKKNYKTRSRPGSSTIRATLASATCALLGSQVPTEVHADEDPDWEFNSALLYYSENDDRVEDYSLNMLATRNFLDDRSLTLGLTVDSLTGATPIGAIQQGVPQTFTRPSGKKVNTVPADAIPLDDSFLDTRYAINASWAQPLGRLYQLNLGASASFEYDYTHFGINAGIARDFNNRNTTLSAGLAFASDSIDPVGGAPMPLTPMPDVGDLGNREGDQTKDVIDVVLGVSQVISRDLLVQLNYSFSDSSGYLNDPYKIVSVVDGTSGDTIAHTPAPGLDGPSHEYLFEGRPDSRTKHSIFTQAKYYMDGKVLDASYRFMTDDWDIQSHTADLRYRWPLGNAMYVEPHFRFYTQSEADFYQTSIVDGAPLPAFASNDYRLGNFAAITAGIKFGWQTRGGSDMSVRVEWYQQRGDIPSGQLFGNQVSQVRYPDLDAMIVQFSYRFQK